MQALTGQRGRPQDSPGGCGSAKSAGFRFKPAKAPPKTRRRSACSRMPQAYPMVEKHAPVPITTTAPPGSLLRWVCQRTVSTRPETTTPQPERPPNCRRSTPWPQARVHWRQVSPALAVGYPHHGGSLLQRKLVAGRTTTPDTRPIRIPSHLGRLRSRYSRHESGESKPQGIWTLVHEKLQRLELSEAEFCNFSVISSYIRVQTVRARTCWHRSPVASRGMTANKFELLGQKFPTHAISAVLAAGGRRAAARGDGVGDGRQRARSCASRRPVDQTAHPHVHRVPRLSWRIRS